MIKIIQHFLFTFLLTLGVLYFGAKTYQLAIDLLNSEAKSEAQIKKSDKYIYLTNKNTVNLRGAVTWSSVSDWSMDLAKAIISRKNNEPIYLVINSPGGSISAGMSFIYFVKQFDNVHTVTIFGASMASAIAMAIDGNRYVTPNGEFMFHRARTTISGQVEEGELEERLRKVKRLVRNLETINADRIGISLEEYKKRVKDEWWVDSEESLKKNVADKLVNLKCSKDLMMRYQTRNVPTAFGVRKVKFSKCPLIEAPLNL